MIKKLIFDSFLSVGAFPAPVLREASQVEGFLRVILPVAILDKQNLNHRVYPRESVQRAIESLTHEFDEGMLTCTVDGHPDRSRPVPGQVSHVVTRAWIESHEGQDYFMNEWKILNTSRGFDLQALLKGGVSFGVSIRGFAVTENDDGTGRVTDYEYLGADAVDEPAASLFVSAHARLCQLKFENLPKDQFMSYKKTQEEEPVAMPMDVPSNVPAAVQVPIDWTDSGLWDLAARDPLAFLTQVGLIDTYLEFVERVATAGGVTMMGIADFISTLSADIPEDGHTLLLQAMASDLQQRGLLITDGAAEPSSMDLSGDPSAENFDLKKVLTHLRKGQKLSVKQIENLAWHVRTLQNHAGTLARALVRTSQQRNAQQAKATKAETSAPVESQEKRLVGDLERRLKTLEGQLAQQADLNVKFTEILEKTRIALVKAQSEQNAQPAPKSSPSVTPPPLKSIQSRYAESKPYRVSRPATGEDALLQDGMI